MSDRTIRISLADVRFHSRIGVFEQERKVGNDFVVNLMVEVAVTAGMTADRIDGTVSYADLYRIVNEIMSEESLTLEYVALTIAETIRQAYPQVLCGEISIEKTAPPIPGMHGSAVVSFAF